MACPHSAPRMGYCQWCGIQLVKDRPKFDHRAAIADIPIEKSVLLDAKAFRTMTKFTNHDINEDTGKCVKCKAYWKEARLMCVT